MFNTLMKSDYSLKPHNPFFCYPGVIPVTLMLDLVYCGMAGGNVLQYNTHHAAVWACLQKHHGGSSQSLLFCKAQLCLINLFSDQCQIISTGEQENMQCQLIFSDVILISRQLTDKNVREMIW